MKPLNINNTPSIKSSSNTIIWEGPDIPCINLCKGDTVTDVIYKLATELCTILGYVDITSYDLKCFEGGVCKPADFHAFIQLLINKICALESCSPCANVCGSGGNPVTINPTTSSPTNTLKVAPAFHYQNQFGDTVTTMTLDEYATAIGNKVYSQITSITTLQNSLADYNSRITELENRATPVMELPSMIPTGVLPKQSTDLLSVVQAMEAQFTQHKNALGTPNQVYSNIQKQIPNLNEAKSLSNPGAIMSSLEGWNTTVTSHADSLGNLWLTIADIRKAVQNLVNNYLPNDCSAVSIKLTATYADKSVKLFLSGSVPSSFSNTYNGGTKFTISDTNGNKVVSTVDILSVLNNVSGAVINLESSILNDSSNLTITAEPSFTNKETGSQCQSFLQYHIVNKASCPFVTFMPSSHDIYFLFTSENGNRIYTIELWEQTGTEVIASQTFTTTSLQPISGAFKDLISNTQYKGRVIVNINGVVTTCEFTAIKTL